MKNLIKILYSKIFYAVFLPITLVAVAPVIAYAEEKPDLSVKQKLAELMMTDQKFIEKAAKGNLLEIQLSEQALTKSFSTEIKSFAQTIIDDHSAVDKGLAEISGSMGIRVPDGLDSDQKDVMDSIKDLSGSDFDKAYTKRMRADHDDAVSLFEVGSADTKLNPKLRKFSDKTLPTLRQHKEHAHELDNKINHNT